MSNKPKNFNDCDGSVSKLAREIGTSISTVSKKRLAGKSDAEIRQEAIEWNSKQETDLEDDGARETHSQAVKRKESAIASLRELELAQKSGELVPLVEINSFVAGMIIRARQVLARIAPELADRLAKESNPQRVRELIDAEVNRALIQLSQFIGTQI